MSNLYRDTLEELIDEKKLEFEMAEVALVDATRRAEEAGIPYLKIFKIVAKELDHG